MHILLIYKLATKQLEIKNQSQRAQTTPKPRKKIQNWKICRKICAKRVYDSPPHLNLTVSLLEAEEIQPGTKMPKHKTKQTKQCTNIYKVTH